MSTPTITPVSYSYDSAALATGLSVDVIRRAARAGELPLHYPRVDGRPVSKPVILRDDLAAWVADGEHHRRTA